MERRGHPTDRATVPPSLRRVPLTSACQLLANPDEAAVDSHDFMHQRGGRAKRQDRTRNPLLSVFARPPCSDLRSRRARALGSGEPAALGVGRGLPRSSGTLQDRRRAAEHGHHPPYRAQSAVTGQTHGQSEEPAKTRWLECRLPRNCHPPDRVTFKRLPFGAARHTLKRWWLRATMHGSAQKSSGAFTQDLRVT